MSDDAVPSGRGWWGWVAVGSLVMAYGAYGLIANLLPEERPRWVVWFVGGLLVHDLLLAPAALAVGLLVRRLFPASLRGPIAVGLIATGVLVLASVPVVLGYGRASQPGNTSVLPLDYLPNLLGVIAVVWLLVAATAGLTRLRP